MTNHPNRGRSYWLLHPRNFANEYIVGVATTQENAEQYEAEDFERIDRDAALRLMSRRPGNGEQLYISVTVDGEDDWRYDRYEIARSIRTGSDAAL